MVKQILILACLLTGYQCRAMESNSGSSDTEITANTTLSEFDVIVFNNYTDKTHTKIQKAVQKKQERDLRYFKSLSFREQYILLNLVAFSYVFLKP